MSAGRRPFVAAVWLIGLGVVFLAQRVTGWSWNEAWPLFVILVGVGGLTAAVADDSRHARGIGRFWSLTWPVSWLVAGTALLAATSGRLPVGPAEMIDGVWPWVALVLGVWFLVGALVGESEPPVRDAPRRALGA